MIRKGLFWFGATFCIAVGVMILNNIGLLVGGTVGLGLLLHYVIHRSTSQIIFILNIPFYMLSFYCLGLKFTFKTMLSVTLLSFLSGYVLPLMPHFPEVTPLLGALLGGACLGIGIAMLMKMSTSIGGITVLATYLEQKYKIAFQTTMFIFDFLILGISSLFFPISVVLYSLLTVIIMNIILRYQQKASV